MSENKYISYDQAMNNPITKAFWLGEIPESHASSLAIPTLRFNLPVFARFTCPAYRRPGQPMVQGAPDRWWAIHAATGKLVFYALWSAVPFAEDFLWQAQELPHLGITLEQFEVLIGRIPGIIDGIAPGFFNQLPVSREVCREFLEVLHQVIPAPLFQFYERLAPDFFDYLRTNI
jgi:hypothetical protein